MTIAIRAELRLVEKIPEGYILVKEEEWKAVLAELATLRKEVIELRARLNITSKNSSKPPSSDGYRRNRSLRARTGKRPGGQPGHKGSRLQMSAKPDEIITLVPDNCPHCGGKPSGKVVSVVRRQEIDIPEPRQIVREYVSVQCNCSGCNQLLKGKFPEHIVQDIQYGNSLKGMLVYLNSYQMIPQKRTAELMEDVYGISLSEATIISSQNQCSDNLSPHIDVVKEAILASKVAGFDETGMHVSKSLFWLHTASTPELTFMQLHPRRGKEAMDAIGILPKFTGVAVHDRWASYFKFDNCDHSLCNAHLGRELKHLHEDFAIKWAGELEELIFNAKKLTEEKSPSQRLIHKLETRFHQIVESGLRKCKREGGHSFRTGKRGREKQSKAKNLLDDLKQYQEYFLKFLTNPQVPFDNNGSERDIRMSKVKMKISGCFRSVKGAETFVRIRGYINTVIKQGVPVLQALRDAIAGNPFLPYVAE